MVGRANAVCWRCQGGKEVCRRSLRAGGRILVIDAVIPPGNGPHAGKLLDVLMLASLPGRERRRQT